MKDLCDVFWGPNEGETPNHGYNLSHACNLLPGHSGDHHCSCGHRVDSRGSGSDGKSYVLAGKDA